MVARLTSFGANRQNRNKGRGSFVIIDLGLDPGDWVVIEGDQQAQHHIAKVDPQRYRAEVGRSRLNQTTPRRTL